MPSNYFDPTDLSLSEIGAAADLAGAAKAIEEILNPILARQAEEIAGLIESRMEAASPEVKTVLE
jgi:hypothetical protein